MAALLPISRYATETTPLSVITVMHITSALVHSNTAQDPICSLVFLYIRNWINQISFASQALFKIFICLVGRFIDGDESKSCKLELLCELCLNLCSFCPLHSYFNMNHVAVYNCEMRELGRRPLSGRCTHAIRLLLHPPCLIY